MHTITPAGTPFSGIPAEHPVIRLPKSLADFEKRGFQLHRPDSRALLENHARHFLAGFNLAVRYWRAPHEALATLPEAERGFAYEGAGMYAALRDLLTAGRSGALRLLLSGPGAEYVHLVHVGAGWYAAPLRLPLPTVPATALLRWLALDGEGFATTFFGGLPALRRRCRRAARGAGPGQREQIRLAGGGRALWFLTSADVDLIAAVIAGEPAAVATELWSGIGLAAGYAGGVDTAELARLAALAGVHRPSLGQGVTFAAGARVRGRHVPAHTELACRTLLGVNAATAARWTDEAADGLRDAPDPAAFLAWRAALRERLRGGAPAAAGEPVQVSP